MSTVPASPKRSHSAKLLSKQMSEKFKKNVSLRGSFLRSKSEKKLKKNSKDGPVPPSPKSVRTMSSMDESEHKANLAIEALADETAEETFSEDTVVEYQNPVDSLVVEECIDVEASVDVSDAEVIREDEPSADEVIEELFQDEKQVQEENVDLTEVLMESIKEEEDVMLVVDSELKSSEEVLVVEPSYVTMKVLLLAPSERKFELVSIECLEDTVVQCLINDLTQHVGTDETFKSQRYRGLCRGMDNDEVQEFDIDAILSTYNVEYDKDVLIAIPEVDGRIWSAVECSEMASAILKQDSVIEAKVSPEETITQPVEAVLAVQKEVDEVEIVTVPQQQSQFSLAKLLIKLLVVGIFCVVFQSLVSEHMDLVKPLEPDSVLSVGDVRSRCGLIEKYIPIPLLEKYGHQICQPAFLEFTQDGSLVYSEGFDRVKVWEMRALPKRKAVVVTSNVDLEIDSEGKVKMFGMPATIKYHKKGVPLSPWPFAKPPTNL